MIILKRANAARLELTGYQTIETGVKYTLNPCLIWEGNRVFNPITEEAVLLDKSTEKRDLVRGWYMVPAGFDVVSMVHMIRQRQLTALAQPRGKTGYTIFTTTVCNASCEYCFERDYDVITMTKETAEKVADYIIKTSQKNGRQISIKWFGGEPLVNKEAINIICTRLTEYRINFASDITTNGDLLPGCTDSELKLWRVKTVQLTLDDVGSEYDRIKGIPGAYKRLEASVGRLADLGIKSSIRIHFSPEKGADACYRVADALMKRKNVSMYCRILYGNETPEDYEKLLHFEDYLIQNKMTKAMFPNGSNGSHCMADRPTHVCITPTGALSPCEHYAYGENMYGDISTNRKSGAVLSAWSQKEKHITDLCKKCPLYACCEKIVLCPSEGKCENGYREYQIARIKRALRSVEVQTSRKMITGATKEELVQMCGVC